MRASFWLPRSPPWRWSRSRRHRPRHSGATARAAALRQRLPRRRAGRRRRRQERTGFEYQRHRDYRAADRGYSSRDNQRDAYTQQYRAGFVAGYRDGFYSAGGRGAGARRAPTPWYGGTPDRRPSGYGGVSDDIGYANGFEEGYKRGADDGRDRDRYDPRRHGRYRDADQGYRREYGPKGVYEVSYRRGFERGYDQGYNEGERRRDRWQRDSVTA